MAENYDQIRTRSPLTSLDGTETFTVNQGGLTKGGFLSVLRDWIVSTIQVTRAQISDATAFGRSLLGLDDKDALLEVLEIEPAAAIATSAELEAGTETGVRSLSPSLVVEAIAFHTAKDPHFVDADTTLTEANVGEVLVCDSDEAIEVTVPVLAITTGKFQIINLALDAVTILPGSGVTLLDNTGNKTEIEVVQYAHVEFIYISDDTWYLRVQ